MKMQTGGRSLWLSTSGGLIPPLTSKLPKRKLALLEVRDGFIGPHVLKAVRE